MDHHEDLQTELDNLIRTQVRRTVEETRFAHDLLDVVRAYTKLRQCKPCLATGADAVATWDAVATAILRIGARDLDPREAAPLLEAILLLERRPSESEPTPG